MSDNGPTITVTRGSRPEQADPKPSASSARSRSSGWGLPGPGAVVSSLVRGARAAWWAGLGVVGAVQDAGTQVFDALVEEGRSWERAERERRAQTARRVRQATDETDPIRAAEERVQTDVNDILRRVGVPSRDDLEELRERVDALGARIEALARSIEEADSYP
ncbi:phasin family protein [Salinibacter sp.]|uniref:phasin family protein n=1 Tax=Salinibacter sp. TaxID=2065818 RepID=UPI0021E8A0B4|nr:phasin family protein [Salinibacter sp.]